MCEEEMEQNLKFDVEKGDNVTNVPGLSETTQWMLGPSEKNQLTVIFAEGGVKPDYVVLTYSASDANALKRYSSFTVKAQYSDTTTLEDINDGKVRANFTFNH